MCSYFFSQKCNLKWSATRYVTGFLQKLNHKYNITVYLLIARHITTIVDVKQKTKKMI